MSSPLLVSCPVVEEFEFTWDAAVAALEGAPVLHYGQTWLSGRQVEFRDGRIQLGWRGNRFFALATLTDDVPISWATERNQHLYLLGDVLELFAGVSGKSEYIEYHYSPNGLTFQLFWTDLVERVKTPESGKTVDDFVVVDDDTRHVVRRCPGGWQVLIDLPAAAIGSNATSLAGETWDLSFGRYDYSEVDGKPVLSNTSPLTAGSYHRRHEWRRVLFTER